MKAIVLLVAGCLLLAGCTASPPIGETRLVAKSFDNLNTASQPLLDELAVAERKQGKTAALTRAEMRTSVGRFTTLHVATERKRCTDHEGVS